LDESVGHHCGIFGLYNVPDAASKTYLGLFAQQHRGQESAGIVVSDGKKVNSKKAMGLVTEVFSKADLAALHGHIAVGHVRYSTTGSSRPQNIQPLLVDYSQGPVAVAHNGNLVNAKRLRDEHEAAGSIFQSSTDSEVLLHLMASPSNLGREDHIAHCLRQLKGAYSLVIMTRNQLIGARDPQGFRPLILGRMISEPNLGQIGEGFVI
jgi:amidophosphoribosyltransferase